MGGTAWRRGRWEDREDNVNKGKLREVLDCFCVHKLDGVVFYVADPSRWNSKTKQGNLNSSEIQHYMFPYLLDQSCFKFPHTGETESLNVCVKNPKKYHLSSVICHLSSAWQVLLTTYIVFCCERRHLDRFCLLLFFQLLFCQFNEEPL